MRRLSTRPQPLGRTLVWRMLVLAVALVAAWLLWSGLYKPLLIGLGALSVVLTMWLARRMHYFGDDLFALIYDFKLLGYWGWIGREIVSSSLDVARIVLRRELKVRPHVVTLEVSNLTPVDQAVLGNSITLTPGTLTLDVHDDKITVHALTKEGADALYAGEMQRRVAALRKG